MNKFLEKLKENDGYWTHQAGQKYLAELASGKISDTFCNTGVVTTDPFVLKQCVDELFNINVSFLSCKPPTCVVGPAFGGITLAWEISKVLMVKALFTEPDYSYKIESSKEDAMSCSFEDGDGVEKQISIAKDGQKFRFDLPDNSNILFVEDVITTGKSTLEMMNCVSGKIGPDNIGPNKTGWLPFVLCLVNRSGETHINGFEIISLAEIKSRTWDSLKDAQKDLPEVIGALKPKHNWDKLTK